jgi:hypothetical protein
VTIGTKDELYSRYRGGTDGAREQRERERECERERRRGREGGAQGHRWDRRV